MKRKKQKKKRTVDASETYSQRSGSTTDFPEDAEGGLYGESRGNGAASQDPDRRRREEEDIFNQEV